MIRAITHKVPLGIAECELTFIERVPIDFQPAVRQHDRYCAMLKKHGVIVEELFENDSYPDSCFVEDTAMRGETRLDEMHYWVTKLYIRHLNARQHHL